MPNHFSEADWLAFIDNPEDAEESARMRQHMARCESCASLFQSLSAVRESLAAGASEARNASRISPQEIESLLDRCLAGIRAKPHARWSPAEATLLLRVLLEPICGPGTAGATIGLAKRRSTDAAGEQLTSGNWNLFISNLSETMSSICGAAAGTLVRRAGLSIAVQEG